MSRLCAELGGFDGEVVEAGGFEVLEVGGELGGLRGVSCCAFSRSASVSCAGVP